MKQKEKSPEFAPEQQLGFLSWQLSNLWQKYIKMVLSNHKLTYIEFLLLKSTQYFKSLGKNPSQTQLGDYIGSHKMLVSKTLRTLEEYGLVKRVERSRDKRAFEIALTSAGAKLLKQVTPDLHKAEELFFGVEGSRKNTYESILLNLLVSNQSLVEGEGFED